MVRRQCAVVPLRQFALKKRVSEAAASRNGFGLGFRFGLLCLSFEGDDGDFSDGDVDRGFAVSGIVGPRCGLYNRCRRRRRRRRWLLVLCVVVTFCFEPIKRFVFVPQIHLACATHFWQVVVAIVAALLLLLLKSQR